MAVLSDRRGIDVVLLLITASLTRRIEQALTFIEREITAPYKMLLYCIVLLLLYTAPTYYVVLLLLLYTAPTNRIVLHLLFYYTGPTIVCIDSTRLIAFLRSYKL